MPADIAEVVSYRVAKISSASAAIVLIMLDHRFETTIATFFREGVMVFVEDINRAIAHSFASIEEEVVHSPSEAVARQLKMAFENEPPLPTADELAASETVGERTHWTILPRTNAVVLRREIVNQQVTDFYFSPALAYILAFRLNGALGLAKN